MAGGGGISSRSPEPVPSPAGVPSPVCPDPARFAGGVDCMESLLPQHAIVPSNRTPHVCASPVQVRTSPTTPQLYVPPQLTSMNSFMGTAAPPQSPQHLTVASPSRPHECDPPLLIPRKTASTGVCVRWPELSLPQHTGLPCIVRAHVCSPPLAMALNVPSGGDNFPCASSPQQTGLPFALSAHV